MLFSVYFFNNDTMNTPNPDKPEPNRDKAKILVSVVCVYY